MALLKTTCPRCTTTVDLHPDEIVAASTGEDAAQYAFVCPACHDFAVRNADRHAIELLLSTGVTPAAAGRPVHPESPPAGPALTRDDVLDMHLLLATTTWFDRLLSTSTH